VFDGETQKNDLDIVREVLSHQGSSHRARQRFQLCKESGQRTDPSGLDTLEPSQVERCELHTKQSYRAEACAPSESAGDYPGHSNQQSGFPSYVNV
jgi:hypothetical protein